MLLAQALNQGQPVQAADFLDDAHTLTQLCSMAAQRLFHASALSIPDAYKRKRSQLSGSSSVVLCKELVQVRILLAVLQTIGSCPPDPMSYHHQLLSCDTGLNIAAVPSSLSSISFRNIYVSERAQGAQRPFPVGRCSHHFTTSYSTPHYR